jgi:hypothetical protein
MRFLDGENHRRGLPEIGMAGAARAARQPGGLLLE